ncbi:alpha-amylase family protein [Maribacter litopenaei]|uniref:Alpha-amylase family protein n=1 Tax=Maribacter litopenaei TaxID=2976127 RepID=A0ABY5Y8P9_9FLAO|nr:alpha-amylase family protein [Maribacter litopenaei]UWX54629.1 alpha-amylase family protein [Maribacter litopenaei]
MRGKVVIYHVFTRLFGNTKTTNKPWGTIEENGVGKFADFDDKALSEIKNLGVSHIWYTGVPHHAVIRDYTDYGISNDDPNVVKGRAGSPYAVKDYYNVNPDLAIDPSNRLVEYKELIERTHKHGMKVIIDIVPNHVARAYHSITNPDGATSFGADDDTDKEYQKNNNFYYIPGSSFKVPDWKDGYRPLGGEKNKSIGTLKEKPAKWTGNGSRSPKPDMNDWYETIRVNYGIKPDGGLDFDLLPYDFGEKDYKEHFRFSQHRDVPDSWIKFRDIALYWLDFGVDGFRYDMAEMIPVEFRSFMNSYIKMRNEDAFLMAEVYNPDLYRTFIHKGKMDYLYDKVDFYDGLKHIMKGYGWSDHIPVVQNNLKDIEHHMLHFLENHDEQRIASPEFVGRAEIAKPAMVVSATISSSPLMIYFGQEVGEPAAENPGFGSSSGTSIFDYVGVPHHQRWVNNKKFDGGQLSEQESDLRDFYKRLLNFTLESEALMGEYREIHFYNKELTQNYNHRVLSFVRCTENQKLIIVVNFEEHKSFTFDLKLPTDLIELWALEDGHYILKEMLYGQKSKLSIINKGGHIDVRLEPLESFIFEIQ